MDYVFCLACGEQIQLNKGTHKEVYHGFVHWFCKTRYDEVEKLRKERELYQSTESGDAL